MYLSKLKLWNFRKFASVNELIVDKELRDADLEVNFQKGLNVLIGENDSGKTAIIDAIKFILKTHSVEWFRLENEDFSRGMDKLRIECRFDDLSSEEAKNFTEWLGIEGEGGSAHVYLKINLVAQKNNERILPFEIKAGADDAGHPLNAEAREYLKATYLKPLRDAKGELIPKRNSRLSQILQGHEAFKGNEDDHKLKNISACFNCLIKKYFNHAYKDDACEKTTCVFQSEFYSVPGDADGKEIKTNLDGYLKKFFGKEKKSEFDITEQKIKNILETLRLILEEGDLGLGSHNLLFIASELLNLQRKDWDGVRLGLIEELEAHLHPQAQMRVIEALQQEEGVQFILTTHSPNLASKVNLENLLICAEDAKGKPSVFSMRSEETELEKADYQFLERFLDVTKANLFFAKGIIMVEGWAEEILIPVLAEKIEINLTEKGVSIVNVGSTAFLRYAKIFQRKDGALMKIPVSVITDVDIKPADEDSDIQAKINEKENKYNNQRTKGFVSPHWTLEYCLGLSPLIAPLLFDATKAALKEMRDNGSSTRAEIADAYESKFYGHNQAAIALGIYNDIILGKKISKSIIAQRLAGILENNSEIKKRQFEDDPHIKYLVDAIKYASGGN